MSTLLAMIRRVRTLWAALVRRLGGGAAPAQIPAPAPVPSLAAASAAALAAEQPSPAASASVVAVEVPPPAASASALAAEEPSAASASLSLSATPTAEPVADEAAPEHVRGDMSVSAAASAVVAGPAPARGPSGRGALRADAGPALSVRQFFARVAAGVPGGQTVDFRDWQTARVERYFLAVSSSGRAPQRGPAIAEVVALKRAFDDFEWD